MANTANLTRSQGIALIAGLLLMSSMVLLALAVASGVLLERRAAGNFSDAQLALNRAQLAGKWGEYWLFSQAENPLAIECESECEPTPMFAPGTLPRSPEFEDKAWWQLNAVTTGIEPVSGQVRMDYSLPGIDDAYWLIEEVHLEPLEEPEAEAGEPEPMLGYYRVFGRGSGKLSGSVAVTESVVARPWIDSLQPSPFPPNVEAPWFCEPLAPEIACGRVGWRRRR